MLRIKINDLMRSEPVLTCDHCTQPIEHVEQGWCMWRIDGDVGAPGIESDLSIVHKPCSYVVERQFPGNWKSMELKHFIFRLGNTLRINWPEVIGDVKDFNELP